MNKNWKGWTRTKHGYKRTYPPSRYVNLMSNGSGEFPRICQSFVTSSSAVRTMCPQDNEILIELRRLRQIQECGGVEQYHKIQSCIAMNGTCLGASSSY